MPTTLLIAGGIVLALFHPVAWAATDVAEAAADGVIAYVITLLAAILTAAGTYALRRLADRFGIERDTALYKTVEETIYNGIAYARARSVAATGGLRIGPETGTLGAITDYVNRQAPAELKKLGMTEARLERWTESVLAQLLDAEERDQPAPPDAA